MSDRLVDAYRLLDRSLIMKILNPYVVVMLFSIATLSSCSESQKSTTEAQPHPTSENTESQNESIKIPAPFTINVNDKSDLFTKESLGDGHDLPDGIPLAKFEEWKTKFETTLQERAKAEQGMTPTTYLKLSLYYGQMGDYNRAFLGIDSCMKISRTNTCDFMTMQVEDGWGKERWLPWLGTEHYQKVLENCGISESTAEAFNGVDSNLSDGFPDVSDDYDFSLAHQLKQIRLDDQKHRGEISRLMFQEDAGAKLDELWEKQRTLDEQNLALVKEILQSGYPSQSQVGNELVHVPWMVLHHSTQYDEIVDVVDEVFEAVANKDLPTDLVYRLIDRMHYNEFRTQIFGTQTGYTDSEGVYQVVPRDNDDTVVNWLAIARSKGVEVPEPLQPLLAENNKEPMLAIADLKQFFGQSLTDNTLIP